MGKGKALKCEKCAGPMENWRECEWCGTKYTKELERQDWMGMMSCSSSVGSIYTHQVYWPAVNQYGY